MQKWLALLSTLQLMCAATAIAQDSSQTAWKACQSSDADERLRGCTAVIDASGFGSQSKLADAFDGRCWAHHVKQQFSRAIEDCKASIRIRPKYSYAYNNLGTAYAGLGNYADAIAAFNTAIKLKPDFFWSRYSRAKAFVALGEMDKAIADYEYLLTRDPTNQDVKNSLQQLKTSIVQPKPENLPSPPKVGLADHPNPVGPSTSGERFSVAMRAEGGVYVVPILINDAITLDFVVDSGAADVSIPADVVSTLIRTRTIGPSDFVGQQTYVLADGSETPSDVFIIRSLKVGNHVVLNVRASIASPKASLLLGQSFLQHFRSWSIDNARHALVLE
jgi:predicted aspartyl protease